MDSKLLKNLSFFSRFRSYLWIALWSARLAVMRVVEFAGRVYTAGRGADNSSRNKNDQPSITGGRDRGRGRKPSVWPRFRCSGKMPAWQSAPEQSGYMWWKFLKIKCCFEDDACSELFCPTRTKRGHTEGGKHRGVFLLIECFWPTVLLREDFSRPSPSSTTRSNVVHSRSFSVIFRFQLPIRKRVRKNSLSPRFEPVTWLPEGYADGH